MLQSRDVLSINQTESFDVGEAVYRYTLHHSIPLLTVESIGLGMASISFLLWIYATLRGCYRASLKKTISRGILAGLVYVAFLVHWIFTFKFNSDCLTGLVLAGSVEGNMGAPIFFLPIQMFYTVIEALLFGMLTSLTIVVVVLSCKDSSPRTLKSMLPSAAVIVMFLMALAHLAIGITIWGVEAFSWTLPENTAAGRAMSVVFSINVILSDAIVLWRACVVWNNRKSVVYSTAALFLATLAFTITNLVLGITQGANSPGLATNSSDPFTTPTGMVALGISLLSNVFATGAPGYQSLQHRRRVGGHLADPKHHTMAENILLILVECGILYVCLWIVFIAGTINTWIHADFVVVSSAPFLPVYDYCMIQIISLYPTIILILVVVEKSLPTDYSTASPSSRRARSTQFVTVSTRRRPTPTDVVVEYDGHGSDTDSHGRRSGDASSHAESTHEKRGKERDGGYAV